MWFWTSPKTLNFNLRLVTKSDQTMNLFSNSLYHGWQRKADDQGQAHGHLCEAPSSSKVSCPHFFIDVHFQSVSVAPIADAIDPAEHDITTVQSAQYDIKDMKKYKIRTAWFPWHKRQSTLLTTFTLLSFCREAMFLQIKEIIKLLWVFKSLKSLHGTIHLRLWQIFMIFVPTPYHWHFFFTSIHRQIWSIFWPLPP